MSVHDLTSSEALARLSVNESSSDAAWFTRRRFLQAIAVGVGTPIVFGGLDSGLGGFFDPAVAGALDISPIASNDGIVVLIGMYGGNDGINTVVPYANPDYARRRGALALDPSTVLPIDANIGLHPALVEVKRRYDMGQVAVVQGVGYPSSSLSHFASMYQWMNAGAGSTTAGTGWIGRWLDESDGNILRAVTVGQTLPLHLLGRRHRASTVGYNSGMFGTSADPAYRRHYDALRKFSATPSDRGPLHDSIAGTIAQQLDLAGVVSPLTTAPFPAGELPAKMEMAARLINANIGCRVLDVGFGSFDTHANELVDHGRKMAEFDAAIARFYSTLNPALVGRVTIVTWSEFGRTLAGNASGGTDHGTSSSLFVMGGNVRGGLYGEQPSLAGTANWDRPVATVDYRSVYTSVIDGWLGGGAATILGSSFENLGLFRSAPTGSFPAPGPTTIADPATYVGIVPQRIFDSRNAIGTTRRRRLGPGERVAITVAGVGAIPANGVVSVAVNITSTDATSDSYLTAWPSDRPQPDTSNLNPRPGRTVPNFALVTLGADGTISLFNERGSGHVLVDVVGYCTASGGSGFVPLAPTRIMDSRSGVGVPSGRIGPGRVVELMVAGAGGVPAQGADVAILNITATGADAESFVTVWPTGASMPDASTLNMSRDRTVPNLVFARVGSGGRVSLYNSNGSTHLIADVVGCFSANSNVKFVSVAPTRILDTRRNLGAVGPVTNRPVALSVPGLPSGTVALMLNVTATAPTTESYATVWASGRAQPETSNLNYTPGDTVANAVIAEIGSDGRIQFVNAFGSVQLIADLVGYFVA
jgi:uncharacterized protein (DUF1501 family)